MASTEQAVAPKVVVIGATGNIGRPLCAALAAQGYHLTVFSRDPSHARSSIPDAQAYTAWLPDEELSDECVKEIASATMVVYLAGAPLFDGHRHNRQQIEEESRARAAAMRKVAAVLSQHKNGAVYIAASSVGIYGYQEPPSSRQIAESRPAGSDWWGKSSSIIEEAAMAAKPETVRIVLLRTGYILTQRSLASQVAQFEHHFGGWIGTGNGWVPWVHIDDVVGLIMFALRHQELAGPLNVSSPNPVISRAFAKALGRVIDRRAWLPAPTFLAGMGLGVLTDILVKGKRVVPEKASSLGYKFQFPTIDDALHDLLPNKDGV